MKTPTNYLEWCKLFDEITTSSRNEEFMDAVRHGTISWTSGVAERFVRSASEMIRKRVNSAHDSYQRQMKNARGVSNNLVNALNSLHKEYQYVYKLANVLPIPEEYRATLVKSVVDQANQTQTSLEDSAKADRTGRLLILVRNAKVNKLG